MSINFNINGIVEATLTEFGAEVWNSRYDNLPIPAECLPKRSAAGDVIRTQLWDFMNVFGAYTQLCSPAVIVDCEIKLTPN